jgi:predicted dehydrogenase
MLKIGVFGAGHLGRIHLKCLREISGYEIVGFHDINTEHGRKVAEDTGLTYFESAEDLIKAVDVVDIVTPTVSHFDIASKAFKSFKHVFIEKPLTETLEEAKALMGLQQEAGIKVQVGHVERFNPAFVAARPYLDKPMFIETHRLAQFNPRGTDVSVVLDLMIHDIDIVLSVINSGIKRISAGGVAVVSETPDIANARIEFDNGCVANLTASRISMKNMRKSRFFQKDAYISVDFLEKTAGIIKIKNIIGEPDPLAITINPGGKSLKQIFIENPKVKESNAIKDELTEFMNSIINDTIPPVPLHQGYAALEVAHQIVEKLKTSSGLMQD